MPAKTYKIHDNGGTPFIVKDFGKFIEVFTPEDMVKPIYDTDYKAIFVGADPLKISPLPWNRRDRGNSIVVQRHNGEFIFIGWKIQSFKLKPGDEAKVYESYVGNNDVPYPYLVGTTHTYLMIEERVIPNEVLDLKKDVYAQYYGFKPGPQGPVKPHAKRLAMKVLHKRR